MDVDEAREKVRRLKDEVADVKEDIRELNETLTTYVALADKMGLDPNIMGAIRTLQRARLTAEMAYRSFIMLSTATSMLGLLGGVGGLGLAALMLIDQMSVRRSRY